MQCPVCKVELVQAGRTHKCETCDGAWVREEVLVPLLEQRTSSLVTLPWKPSGESHVRACPECGGDMKTMALGTVALDHCEIHGVWFDAKELAALLRQAKAFRSPEMPHQSLIGRLAKLF